MNTNNTNKPVEEAYDLVYLNDDNETVHAQVKATSCKEAIDIFHKTNPVWVLSCDSVANSSRLRAEAAEFLAALPKSDLQSA